MDYEHWKVIEQNFHRLVDLEPEPQQAALEVVKRENPEIMTSLAKLLREHDMPDSVISCPIIPGFNDIIKRFLDEDERSSAENISHPLSIGPYRVLKLIGSGAMGIVYLCQQKEPKRLVAIKILKNNQQLPKGAFQRFEAEAQALAIMQHRYITQVYHSNLAEDTTPYLVMEYVEGPSITDFCDQHRLGLKDRILLFMKICEGVLHAHSKGIIHRDLKPSNILVTWENEEAIPKIIDFGIARAMYKPLTNNPLETMEGAFVGTPAYMSPEQTYAGTGSLDTKSDIYSLGAIFYEILTGCCIIDPEVFRVAPLETRLKMITSDVPLKPSDRVSNLGAENEDMRTLHRVLKGDLDAIVMKALDKQPQFRYLTASDLINDLANFLDQKPVLARRHTNTYIMKKYLGRHRSAAAVLGFSLLILIGGLVLALNGWWHANIAEKRTAKAQMLLEQELKRTIAHDQFLRKILASPRPNRKGSDLKALDMLADASEALDSYPEILVMGRSTLGDSYSSLGEFRSAYQQYMSAYEAKQELQRSGDEETAMLLSAIARCCTYLYRTQEARKWYADAIALQSVRLGSSHIETLESRNGLAHLEFQAGNTALAVRLYRENLTLIQKNQGYDLPITARCHVGLGQALTYLREFEDAREHFRTGLAIQKIKLKENHTQTLVTLQSIAFCLLEQRKYEEASNLFRETLERQSFILHEQHPHLYLTMMGLGICRYKMRDFGEASVLIDQAALGLQSTLGPMAPETASALGHKAIILGEMGLVKEAVEAHNHLLTAYRVQGKEHSPSALSAMNNLGNYLIQLGHFTEAIEVLEETLRIKQRLFGDQASTLYTQCTLAEAFQASGDLETAERLFAKTFDTASHVLTNDREMVELYRAYWGQCLGHQGRLEDAARLLKRSHASLSKSGPKAYLNAVEKMMSTL